MNKLIIALPIVALVACGPSEEQVKREQKNQEVWDAHDAVMPKMDDIMMAEKALNKGITAMKDDSTAMDSTWFFDALATNTQLMKAHDDMMSWMRSYEYPGDSVEFAAAMEYMETERIIISEVGLETDRALHKADSLKQLLIQTSTNTNEGE